MTRTDLTALLPIMILAVTPIAVMLSIAVRRSHATCAAIAIAGLVAALGGTFVARSVAPHDVTMLFHVGEFGLSYVALTILVAVAVLALGYSYVGQRESHPEEYIILLVIATAGACAMALSTHFISFYLGLEILSVSLYGLMAYFRRDSRGTEAGMKYLVLAAASAAFLLFGMALVYAELGTMRFAEVVNASALAIDNSVVLLGVAMMFVSISFKLSIVPFHYWTPDIYEGAPASVVAFTATAGKLGVFSVLVQYFAMPSGPVSEALVLYVAVTSCASMLLGNLMALIQGSLKRLLAYSSIAHMGYVSIAFLTSGEMAGQAISFYLLGYTAASLAAFGVIMALSTRAGRTEDFDRIEDYRGLIRTNPVLGTALVISLLSLAGIPLTVGFLGKLYIVLAGVAAGYWWLLVVLALSSAMGAYYYLRVALVVCAAPGTSERSLPARSATPAGNAFVLACLVAVLLVFGTYPAPVLGLIQSLYR